MPLLTPQAVAMPGRRTPDLFNSPGHVSLSLHHQVSDGLLPDSLALAAASGVLKLPHPLHLPVPPGFVEHHRTGHLWTLPSTEDLHPTCSLQMDLLCATSLCL